MLFIYCGRFPWGRKGDNLNKASTATTTSLFFLAPNEVLVRPAVRTKGINLLVDCVYRRNVIFIHEYTRTPTRSMQFVQVQQHLLQWTAWIFHFPFFIQVFTYITLLFGRERGLIFNSLSNGCRPRWSKFKKMSLGLSIC